MPRDQNIRIGKNDGRVVVPIQKIEFLLIEQSDCLHWFDFLELILLDTNKRIFVRTCLNVIVPIVF